MRYLIVVAILCLSACCPIDYPTYEMQQPAVNGAHKSSVHARDKWADYSPELQAKFLKANADAWKSLDDVYNPPAKGED